MLRLTATRALARSRPVPALFARVESQRPLPYASFLLSRALATEGGAAASSSEAKAEEAKDASAAADEKTAEAAGAAAAEEPVAEEPAAAEGEGDGKPTIDELQTKVEELQEEVKTKHDQVLRALAEAENARRRAAIDVESAHKFAVGKFAKSLLDVADNLSRAAESVPEELRNSDEQPALKGLYEGVQMTEKVLLKTFEEHGMKRQWPIDEKFDPNIHNALFEMPDPTKEPGTIAHVASAGYVLHDRVIRAAGVGIVSKP